MKRRLLIVFFSVFYVIGSIYSETNINSMLQTFSGNNTVKMIRIPKYSFEILNIEVTQNLYEYVMNENPSNVNSWKFDDRRDTGNYPVESVYFYDMLLFCNRLSVLCGLTPVYSIKGYKNIAEWNSSNMKQISEEYEELLEVFFDSCYVDDEWHFTSGKREFEAILNFFSMDNSANGFRLPWSYEWEIAARGGESYFFPGSNSLDEVAWYNSNCEKSDSFEYVPSAVAMKSPNGYGLYDMCGNVRELCWDFMFYDGEGFESRITKGGSFSDSVCHIMSDGQEHHKDAIRINNRDERTGFRIVRNME